MFLSPEFKQQPALQPRAILKQVSESEHLPALVPAYKLYDPSNENPAPVKFDPSP